MHLIRTNIKGSKLYEVQAPAYIADLPHGLILLEMAGAEQACRAVWAFLVKYRRERTVQSLHTVKLYDGMISHTVRIDPLAKYHMTPTKRGLIMFRSEFNQLDGRWMLSGDEETPSPWFADAYQRLVGLPFLPEWVGVLWRAGIENDLLVEPKISYGPIRVWRMLVRPDSWSVLTTGLVKKGALHG